MISDIVFRGWVTDSGRVEGRERCRIVINEVELTQKGNIMPMN
jgi:hypothetical protein